MYNRMRKAIGLVLYLLVGALIALVLFLPKLIIWPAEYRSMQVILFTIGLVVSLCVLTVIYFRESSINNDDDDE